MCVEGPMFVAWMMAMAARQPGRAVILWPFPAKVVVASAAAAMLPLTARERAHKQAGGASS